MYESFPQPKIEKEAVINAFKVLAESGAKSRDELDPSDPRVVEANRLREQWETEREEATKDDPVARVAFEFERTMFDLEAGFTDPTDAEDILTDFVQQTIAEARALSPALADEMEAKTQIYAEKLGIELPKGLTPEQEKEVTTEKVEIVPPTPEQMKGDLLTLEAENEFDDAWIAVAELAGYTAFDDGKGRSVEKGDLSIKLFHYEMRSGTKTYKAIITNKVDQNIKPSSFGLSLAAKVSKAGIQKEFEKLLYKYEHRYDE